MEEGMAMNEATVSMAVVKRAEIVGCYNKRRFNHTLVQSLRG